MRAIGYTRVSTSEQADKGAGLEAQHRAISEEADRRSWELVKVFSDTASGRSTVKRLGLKAAINVLRGGEADGLVVAKLDRLSRSLMDFAGLMEQARREEWAVVALDLGVDTTTPAGEMVANVMASFAQYERRLIGQRTKEGLAVKRSQGVRLGRPPVVGKDLRRRIRRMRAGGLTLAKIADKLTGEGIPTAHGGRRWYPSTVRAILGG